MVMSGAINFYIHEIKFLRKHEYGHWVWYLYAQDCVTDAKRVLGNDFRTRQLHHITFQVLSLFPDQEIILIETDFYHLQLRSNQGLNNKKSYF